MMKDAVNQFYKHNGKIVRLSTLYANITKTRRVSKNGNVYFATVVVDMIVATNVTIPVKITFLEAIGKKREWVAVCSTDTTISDEEMVRIYGKRWSIEVFFKTVKSELAFAKEFQGRSFDMLFAHTTIVYVRYILLAVECRRNADGRTMGELFYLMIDELTDIKLYNGSQNQDTELTKVVHTRILKKSKTEANDDETERMRAGVQGADSG
jgi:hypothetical protein